MLSIEILWEVYFGYFYKLNNGQLPRLRYLSDLFNAEKTLE